MQNTTNKIGTLNEKPLHEALKQWYAQSGDRLEVPVDGSVVDIMRGELLVEIQTGNFAAIKRKLEKLIVNHPVRLVYPIPCEKWIVKLADHDKAKTSRRKSPKRGAFEQVFDELVSFPGLLMNPHFSIEMLLIQEDEVRRYEGIRGWRKRGWVTYERKLLKVVGQRVLQTPADMCSFIPATLIEPFSTSDLAAAGPVSFRLAQKMVYCLRLMGSVTPAGKRGNAVLYIRSAT
ncbi:MAG: hypothetical protein LUQ34_01825 [Euryarchaeota archaeon]|nr:hypothetical protein [Euryarchaeota archaeon]